jgi:hypothetical protein
MKTSHKSDEFKKNKKGGVPQIQSPSPIRNGDRALTSACWKDEKNYRNKPFYIEIIVSNCWYNYNEFNINKTWLFLNKRNCSTVQINYYHNTNILMFQNKLIS